MGEFDNPRERDFFYIFDTRPHDGCCFCGKPFHGPPNQKRCNAPECVAKMAARQLELGRVKSALKRKRDKARREKRKG